MPANMFRVEPITQEHLKNATDLFNDFIEGSNKRACGVCSCSNCPNSEADLQQEYQKCPAKMQITGMIVNSESGEVIGSVKMQQHGMPSATPLDACLHTTRPGEMYIDWMSVSASARGMGAGTRLLEWCEQVARTRGASFLSLGVLNGSPARRLYERHGYVRKQQGMCSSVCGNCVVCCFFGCPFSGHCGWTVMEKQLA